LGKIIDGFYIIIVKNQIHGLTAPSLGAVASLAIADYILNEYF